MSVTREIKTAYRAPKLAMRRQLASGAGESRVLAYIIIACLLIFVSTLPKLSRDAFLNPEVPLEARIAAALFGWVMMMPLVIYVLAALSHAVARVIGGRGDWFGARLALAWALLATTPLWLFNGLVSGFVDPGPGQSLAGAIVIAGFAYIWGGSLWAAETPQAAEPKP